MDAKSMWVRLKEMYSWELFKETYHEWRDDQVPRLAAALSYYAATGIAPLITGVLALAGFVFSTEEAKAELMTQVSTYMGAQGAEVVETIVSNASQPDLARLAGLISLLVLLWSGSNIFVQLQDSLNTIWGVQLRPDLGLVRTVLHRLLPLLMVFGIGLLLLVALVASTALSTVGTFISELLPGVPFIWQIINFLISTAIITLLFGLVFKVLPDVEMAWSDVWPGAALTALLFMVGQLVLGWYLGRQSSASVYGAAGSLIVLLLWLYYSAQIFLFGAEFTQVYATRHGQGVRPAKDAIGRIQPAITKAAAQAASAGSGQHQTKNAQLDADREAAQTWKPSTMALSAASFNDSPLSVLVTDLIEDGRTLFRQEMQLAWAETRATMAQVARNSAFMAGGGLLLYAGVIILLIALPVLLWGITVMPLWFAILLIGLLALCEGGIVVLWARHKFTHLRPIPKQTIETIREDVEVVKEHLAS